MGMVVMVSPWSVDACIAEWRGMLGHNVPSLHVFAKSRVLVMTLSSGALMRPADETPTEGKTQGSKLKYVDSVVLQFTSYARCARAELQGSYEDH